MVETSPAVLLKHLFSISHLMAGQLDFRSAIQAVATEIAQILPHDHLDVCILGLNGQFHTAYESGIETDWGKKPHAPIANSPIRELLQGTVDHILTKDACMDPRFQCAGEFYKPIHDHGLRARIHVPMMVHGEVIGAFSASMQRAEAYDSEHVRIARYIADLLSPYFYALRAAEQAQHSAIIEAAARAREEGLRLGALKLTEALESERQRIGMDLHDQTLADLTRLARHLERLPHASPAPAEAFDPVIRGLHRCMQDLRQIIEQAKPSVLQLFGFAHAVEHYLDRAIRDSGQGIDWTLTDESHGAFDALEPAISVALYRIAQEAINNAVIHAEAGRITVQLTATPVQISLAVSDDGCGIAKKRTRIGSGIDNMKTRARLISARCTLSAGIGGAGTSASIVLPLAAVRQDVAE
ncbi:GAF domain-containing sensor histidine kinase [Pseudotabrizicola alkalilacus]|uniref:histidine kinase n=1 Tax=Pseudotabrizicola alkalilacus TaxID=2305252 RepID=A0A411Z3A0_9RHOB|nr:ATP-binding protein [Pseudotabrizicola alkalilacus]RGP37502.1 sensor histidine kinase [Pseudotabrizicola alkalilacus]